VDFSETGKFVYYTVLAILFWTTYTMVDIPYYSLGAEITQDFDERTRLRIWGSMAIYIAVGIVGFAPLFAALLGGEDMQAGWSRVGMVIGAGALLFDLICWNSTRGKEVFIPESERAKKFNVFHTYLQALKLKPMKFVVGANFFYLLGQAISLGITMHVVMYIAPMTEGQITIFYTSMSVFAIALLPLIDWVATRFGKRGAFVGLIGTTAAAVIVFFFVGIYSFPSFLVMSVIWSLGNGAFWTLCYSMAYDNTELDEFIHGQRREGIFVSFMSFSQKVGNAVGILLLGMILNYVKYDAALETQPDSAIVGMKALFTLIPALFLILAVLLIAFHPLTKAKFKAIEKALVDRRAGREPDTSGFQDLL
jgi:glycoside/pentoside/hexuronide:cation symporter, GPH family